MLLRSLCIDSKRRGDGTKRVTCSWRQLAEMIDVHEETVASWLKHKPIPNDKPWRQIIPIDDKAKYLSLFIPRLRYAYETHNGKTRRIGFMLEILMEDPIVPEDEEKLQQQIEMLQMQQGELGLETYRLAERVNHPSTELPSISGHLPKQQNTDLRYVNQTNPELPDAANPPASDLHNASVNPDNPVLQTGVKQYNIDLGDYVNRTNPELLDHKSELSGKNVHELDILIQQLKQKHLKKNLRREAFEPIVELTETLLDDKHSTGMLYKVLNALYPERLDLFIAAVRVGVEAGKSDPTVNRGAIFVRALRDFAGVAGVELGLNRTAATSADSSGLAGNPGSQSSTHHTSPSFAYPSVNEAIWTETQLLLRRQMTQATYDTIIQGTVLLEQDGHRYTVGVQTEMAKEWLDYRLRDIVQRTLANVVGETVVVEFVLIDEVG